MSEAERTIVNPGVDSLMFSVKYRTANGVEISVAGKEVYEVLAGLQHFATLVTCSECGNCGSNNTTLKSREIKKDNNGTEVGYSMWCNACGAYLVLPQDENRSDILYLHTEGPYVGWQGGGKKAKADNPPRNDNAPRGSNNDQPRHSNNSDGGRRPTNDQGNAPRHSNERRSNDAPRQTNAPPPPQQQQEDYSYNSIPF